MKSEHYDTIIMDDLHGDTKEPSEETLERWEKWYKDYLYSRGERLLRKALKQIEDAASD